ncbi:MAG: chemotaxis protein CheA [Proteobacteria bacterium]|nr:chemotaxis protein CheA [Pseudomonadota bacterium]
MNDDIQKIKETFYSEAQDITEDLDGLLLDIENDPSNSDLLNAIFRSFHTLKGSCSILGFKVLEQFTHHLEDLLDYLREYNVEPSSDVMDILFEGLDVVKEIVAAYINGEEVDSNIGMDIEVRTKAMLPSVDEVAAGPSVAVKEAALDVDFINSVPGEAKEKGVAAARSGKKLYEIMLDLDPDCFAMGHDPLKLLKNLSARGEVIYGEANTDKLPQLPELEPFELYLKPIGVIFSTDLDFVDVDDIFEFAHEGGNVEIHQLTDSEIEQYLEGVEDNFWEDSGVPPGSEQAKKIGDILVEMGDISPDILNKALEQQDKPIGALLVEEGLISEGEVNKALETQKTRGVKPRTSIKVDTEKLDLLVNLVGELVISQTMVSHNDSIEQLADAELHKTLSLLGKITRDIQERVMSMRMIPIKATFQKMQRVERDVSRKAGKDINLKISGEDTELDKTVIDEIGDPLLHILRNALDHGVEPPDEREKAGKPIKGKVSLSAFHQGGSVVIEIKDDGRGLDKDKLIAKGIEKGIIESGNGMTDDQIYSLLFEPGFSTAAQVTGVSGRGVGMDVVRRNVEKLRGKVDIQTELGKGTTFSLRLPLTLAIIDGMVVTVTDNRYIIPTTSIIEFLRPSKDQVFTVEGKGEVVMIRDELFPLIRLHRLFDITPEHEQPWDALVILMEGEGVRACLLVDDLVGQQQVVIKTLGDKFKKSRFVSGGAIMGDGDVGLILDAGGIVKNNMERKRQSAA